MFSFMLRFIGQITVAVAAPDRNTAEDRLRILARLLSDEFSDVLFANHRGEVDTYSPLMADGWNQFDGLSQCFDSFEVHGVAPVADEQGSYLEPVDEAEAESWCLYGHLPGQGLKSIGTFRSRSQAEAVYAGITGHAYRHTGRRNIPWNSAA